MIDTYENFKNKLNMKALNGLDLFLDIIESIISSPSRYAGIFRLSNAETKLLQNITQSREIKLGDFMEQIVTDYLGIVGYNNFPKSLIAGEKKNRLSADQLFANKNQLYLIEQKIRDDHDSTKKRGQFENFDKKIAYLQNEYHGCELNAAIWFIDDSLTKNKNYYLQMIEGARKKYEDVKITLHYGKSIFTNFIENEQIWNELVEYLIKWKTENSKNVEVPNLDTNLDVLAAMKQLSASSLRKLLSNKKEYVLVRKELFSTGANFKLLYQYFVSINDIRKNCFPIELQ